MQADGWNARTWQAACPVPLRSARQTERSRAANDELQASVISRMAHHDGSTLHVIVARQLTRETRIHRANARRMLAQAESLLLRSEAALELRERAGTLARRRLLKGLPAAPNPMPTDDLLPVIAAELDEFCQDLRDYLAEVVAAPLGTPTLDELATEPAWPIASTEAEHLERPPDLRPRRAPRAPRAPTRRGAHVAA